MSFRGRLALVLGLLLPSSGGAANASEPHPHQGIIPRLKLDGRPKLQLTSEDFEVIESGRLWHRSEDLGAYGSGIGIQDIAAPLDTVFAEISGLEAYVGKVPMLQSLKVYSQRRKGSESIAKATYVVRAIPGLAYEYCVEHHASQKKGQLLFYLDYDRRSDFDDMQGKWYLEPHPEKPGWTRVFYQCDIKLRAPSFVKTMLTTQGLISAVGWVKRESELRAPKPGAGTAGAAFAGPGRVLGRHRGVAELVGPPTSPLALPAASELPLQDGAGAGVPAAAALAVAALIAFAALQPRRMLAGARNRRFLRRRFVGLQ